MRAPLAELDSLETECQTSDMLTPLAQLIRLQVEMEF